MKKIICLLTAVLLTASLFAGCTKSAPANSSPAAPVSKTESKVEAPKEVQISVLVAETPALTANLYKTIFDRFEKANPGIKIKKEVYPTGDQNAFTKTLHSTGQLPDVLLLGQDDLPRVEGAMMELPQDLYSLLEDAAIRKYNGKVYNMALSKQIRMNVFYNKDIFAKYNLAPPKSWDEFVNICKTLKSNNVVPIIGGGPDKPFASGAMLHNPMLTAMMQELNPNWPQDMADGKMRWTDAEVKEMIKRWKSLIEAGYYHKGSMSFTYEQYCDEFMKGNAAMVVDGIWASGALDKAKTNVGYFALPGMKGVKYYPVGYGNPLGISAKTKYPEEAKKFLKFMFTDEEAYKAFIQADSSLSTTKKPVSYTAGKTMNEMFKALGGLTGITAFMEVDYQPTGYKPLFQKLGQDLLSGGDADKLINDLEKKYRELIEAQKKK